MKVLKLYRKVMWEAFDVHIKIGLSYILNFIP